MFSNFADQIPQNSMTKRARNEIRYLFPISISKLAFFPTIFLEFIFFYLFIHFSRLFDELRNFFSRDQLMNLIISHFFHPLNIFKFPDFSHIYYKISLATFIFLDFPDFLCYWEPCFKQKTENFKSVLFLKSKSITIILI